MPTLILFCGPPGAGKTTLARRLEAEGRGVRLCTDDWRAGLGVAPADGAFHGRLQGVLRQHALDLLGHRTDVIWEDGLWTRPEREAVLAEARAHRARTELHVFDVPLATLWSRLQQRNSSGDPAAHPLTHAELVRAWEVFQPPTAEELADVDEVHLHRVLADPPRA